MPVVLLLDVDLTNDDRVYSGIFCLFVCFLFFVSLVCAAARDGRRRTDRETFPENYRACKLLI